MAGGATGSADAYRAVRLAHAHLTLLGWVGLAVLGTQFTLWPTVLRTRMVPGLPAVVNAVLLLTVGGLAVATAGLLARQRGLALAGLAAALVPFVRTPLRRRPHARTTKTGHRPDSDVRPVYSNGSRLRAVSPRAGPQAAPCLQARPRGRPPPPECRWLAGR
jgi:hypothetical protein